MPLPKSAVFARRLPIFTDFFIKIHAMRMDTGSYWFVIRPFSAGNMRLVQRGSGEGGVPWEKEREKRGGGMKNLLDKRADL